MVSQVCLLRNREVLLVLLSYRLYLDYSPLEAVNIFGTSRNLFCVFRREWNESRTVVV